MKSTHTDSFVHFLYRFKWLIAVLSLFLFAISILEAKQLKLKSDFKALLPQNFQSVRDLDRILARTGGTSSLIVAIESDDYQASIRFAEDLAKKLNAYPKNEISRLYYNASEVKHFFEDHKFLYMNLDDLVEIKDRLDQRIQQEKLSKAGLYIDFETDEEKDARFKTDDIESKYKEKHANYDGYIDGYLFGEEGKLMAMVVKPSGDATGVEFAKMLVDKIKVDIDSLHPQRYHPSMRVGLAGNLMRSQFEYTTLVNDIVSTALLCVSLVGLAVFIYFRRVRMVFLMAWPVLNAVAWTFAITFEAIGYLTTQTAFLGSIIVGNGINYGLILMARYLEERKSGLTSLDAMKIAFPATFPGTIASSLTTAVGFAALFASNITGFTQFAFIGGLGMILCFVGTYILLPVFLAISEQMWPVARESKLDRLTIPIMEKVAPLVTRFSSRIVMGGALLSILSLALFLHFLPNALEYDFTKLKVQAKGKEISQEATLNTRIRAILGGSITPSILVTDRLDQVIPLCDEIMRKNSLDPEGKRVIASCKTVFSYVPENQSEKIAVLKEIQGLLDGGSTLNFLNDKQREELEKFKAQFHGDPIAVSDLPEKLIEHFREKNGELGKIVLVYPTDKISLWDGKNLVHFADLIRENTLPNGEVITASGSPVIFADLLKAVAKDGPPATILSFLLVCTVVALTFRNRRGIVYIIGTLTFGILWMAGAIALFKFKINFFNFIAIPTTFGIGVDYGVNIYQRYLLEGKGNMAKVLTHTGGAVVLCSMTTIIGYFTLIIASNQALVSFGWIGICGEVTCLLVALFFIPAWTIRREAREINAPSPASPS